MAANKNDLIVAARPPAPAPRRKVLGVLPATLFPLATTLLAAFVVANEIAEDDPAGERALEAYVAVAGVVPLVLLFRQLGDRARGVLEIAVGALGVATTIGMRAYVISKAGLGFVDVVAVPAFLGGVALLVQGSVLVLRPVRRWRRLLAIPAALLIVYFVIWPVAIGLMVTHIPQIELGSRTPADLGIAAEDVTFPTLDGVTLSGWYLPSDNGAAIAVLHGAGSTRTNALEHAAFLHEAGYGALLFDSRGFGLSEGTAMGTGWWGDLDIDAAVTFLAGRPDVDPDRIGVFGLSMGGEEAIHAAASDERIRAVVAEGAGAVRTLADTVSLDGFGRYLAVPHYAVMTLVADLCTRAPRPTSLESAMERIAPRPVLLISAPAEYEFTEGYHAAAPDSTELWKVNDAPHTGALGVHPDEYRARVLALFGGALG
ncbi:MAG: alpha/beta hydrolase [Actinomycetota bacterium]